MGRTLEKITARGRDTPARLRLFESFRLFLPVSEIPTLARHISTAWVFPHQGTHRRIDRNIRS